MDRSSRIPLEFALEVLAGVRNDRVIAQRDCCQFGYGVWE